MQDNQQVGTIIPKRVFLIGATGTIGRAAAKAMIAARHQVVCPVRGDASGDRGRGLPDHAIVRLGDLCDRPSIMAAFAGERFDALVPCLASPRAAVRRVTLLPSTTGRM